MKTLLEHERELDVLFDALKKADENSKDMIVDAILKKTVLMDREFFEKIPLENIDPNNY
jgi:hypothetical protein